MFFFNDHIFKAHMHVVIANINTSTDKPKTVAVIPKDALMHFLFFTS